MIFRFLLLLLIFFAPASVWAACTPGSLYTGTISVPTGGSIVNITLGGDPYTVVSASQIGGDATTDVYEGTWECVATPPPAVLCPDGTPAPNGDVLQCVSQNENVTGDTVQEVLTSMNTGIFDSKAILDVIKNYVSSIPGKLDAVVSAVDQSALSMVNAISAQTTILNNAVSGVTSAVQSVKTSIDNGLTALSLKADLAITKLVDIEMALSRVSDDIVFALHGVGDSINSNLSQVRSAVSAGAAMVKAAVDESALNIVNAINAAHLEAQNAANDFYADSLAGAQDLITAVGYTTSAIGQLPDQIANAILTSEAFAGIQSIPGSLAQIGSDITTAINGMGNDMLATLDGGFDSLNTSISDAIASIDNLTTKAAAFFAGEESEYTIKGASALNNATPDNPLLTPEEVDLSQTLHVEITQTGSCPAPATAEVLGQTITFSFDQICELAQMVGRLIMIIAAFISLRMIFA